MDVTVILGLSIVVQLAVACFALWLIKITGRVVGWIVIAASLLLMVFQRSIPFVSLLMGNTAYKPDLLAEAVTLAISILMLLGAAWLAPLFLGIRRSRDELSRSQQKLSKSEEQFRTIYENSTIGLYRTTPTGEILLANPALVNMLGYSSFDELAERNLEAEGFEPEYPRSRFREQIERDGKIIGLESAWKRKDGTTLFVRESAKAIRDAEGNVLHYEGTVEDITVRKRAENKLKEQREKLCNMANEFAMAEERERRRIANELHDRVGPTLYLTQIKLGELRNGSANSSLDDSLREIYESTQQVLRDVRSLTFELSPPVLYELGFEKALEWLTERFQKHHGIKATFEDDGCPKHLDRNLQVMVFQSVRELMMNVVKHAEAESMKVTTRREDDYLHIDVKDDGIGFEGSRSEQDWVSVSGFGLFSIRERMQLLGGRLEVESEAGRGTTASIVIPLS